MGETFDKDDEQIETEVRSILSFHKGIEQAISRWELVERVFGRQAAANRGNNNAYDRKIREAISKWRETDLICSTSSASGYWIAANMAEVQMIADEYEKRAKDMLTKRSNLLKHATDKFGPQMELFKVN
jgi:hypothetical protein